MTDTKMSVQKSLLTRCLATIHTVEAGPVALHSLSLSNSAQSPFLSKFVSVTSAADAEQQRRANNEHGQIPAKQQAALLLA